MAKKKRKKKHRNSEEAADAPIVVQDHATGISATTLAIFSPRPLRVWIAGRQADGRSERDISSLGPTLDGRRPKGPRPSLIGHYVGLSLLDN